MEPDRVELSLGLYKRPVLPLNDGSKLDVLYQTEASKKALLIVVL